ncbi:TrmB family transcriptional regulator [Candidatus Neomarinimicrobiota bacterium]
MNKNNLKKVMALGLTEMEAKIYIFLLSNTPATGYKISKGINKPTANTYKSIELLLQKGLLILDNDKKKMYTAVPYPDFLSRIKKEFLNNITDVETILAAKSTVQVENRIFSMFSVPQIVETCLSMINRAKHTIFLDIYPSPIDLILPPLKNAINKGVDVYLKTYTDIELKGAEIVIDYRGIKTDVIWPGIQINLIVDGQELLLACFDDAQVYNAIWSKNPYLSIIQSYGILMEIIIDKAINAEAENKIPNLKELSEHYRKKAFKNIDLRSI